MSPVASASSVILIFVAVVGAEGVPRSLALSSSRLLFVMLMFSFESTWSSPNELVDRQTGGEHERAKQRLTRVSYPD